MPRVDLDGFFGLHPRLAPLKPLFDARQMAIVHACGSPDAHALALRRAGLHGDGDARREEHAGRLAQSLPARARAPGGDAVPRRRARAAAAARAAGPRAGAGDRPDRPVRHPRRQRSDMVQSSFESRVRGGRRQRAAFDRARGVRRGEDAEDRRTRRSTRRRTAPNTRARHSAKRCGRSRSSSRRTSVSRSRSPSPATGITTSTRGPPIGQLGDAARRSRARHRRARARPRRSHAGRRRS